MIKGITFDLWDTVFIDDSDEVKRKAAGHLPKAAERRRLVHQFVNEQKGISLDIVTLAYDAVDAAFKKTWHELFVTWPVGERLNLVLQALKIDLNESAMAELVRLHEEMELEFKPDFVPGVHQAIEILKKKYKLCVISDTIFSPGWALRRLLASENLLSYFDAFVFSDEIGRSKPHPQVFHSAAEKLGLQLEEIVHIGDREHNDILGAKKMGMRAVLCTAALDRGSENTKADAVFDDYSLLEKILDELNVN